MRLAPLLAILPAVLAAPAKHHAPELSVSQWQSVQAGFFDGVRSLSSWSWGKADQLVQDYEELIDAQQGGDKASTVWQQLKNAGDFTRLVKVLEFEGKAKEILNDEKLTLTFFAPNDDALKPPHHGGGHHHDDDDESFEDALAELAAQPSLAGVSALLESQPSLASNEHDGDDDDEKKRRRKIFRYIVGQVLKYHGIPTEALTAQQLAQNSTVYTALKANDGSFFGLQRRIKVTKTLVPPAVKLNQFTTVIDADRYAKNGIWHVINHPLLPAPSILDTAYLFPEIFSILTSSIGKIDEKEALQWQYDRKESKEAGHPKFTGTPVATIFAPSNGAFLLLPPRLKFFLFSPFGERALFKILSYHYLPRGLLFSEFGVQPDGEVKWFGNRDDPSADYHVELKLPTALKNATVDIVVDKKKVLPIEGAVKFNIKVNGRDVSNFDNVALNGVGHEIDHLLVPPHHHHDDDEEVKAARMNDSWENWEEWLPAWAAEE